jgi:hypothetical protein
VAELAVPLGVPTLSHGEPGKADAVQFAGALPETATRNDPLVFPGALPAVDWNCTPAGPRLIVKLPEISSETGTLTGPAADMIVIALT